MLLSIFECDGIIWSAPPYLSLNNSRMRGGALVCIEATTIRTLELGIYESAATHAINKNAKSGGALQIKSAQPK